MRQTFRSAGEITEVNIAPIIREGIQLRKNEKAHEYIAGKYGISYTDFLSTGKDRLPTELFRDAFVSISNLTLGAELIIIGFVGNDAFLCQTTEGGGVSIREHFAVIGEGAFLASSVLYQRGQSEYLSRDATIYRVYEAKKYAQRVPSVGEETNIITVKKTSSSFEFVKDTCVVELEKAYKKYGPKDIEDVPDFSDQKWWG